MVLVEDNMHGSIVLNLQTTEHETIKTTEIMKKLFLFITAMTLSAGLWAQETQKVSYLYPVYNTANDPTSGIKEWLTESVDATEVKDAGEVVTWKAGWYVVSGNVTFENGAVCEGAVHLILENEATLKSHGKNQHPGIQVSGEGNSLTIYGQTGQLITDGSTTAAGIGGGYGQDGSNITINGGIIKSFGGATGIGGGYKGSGSNITINGGVVEATGGYDCDGAAGIGGGNSGSGSNITINGGRVIATTQFGDGIEDFKCGAGIGGGSGGVGSNITINNGFVTAVGNGGASGIGNGTGASVSVDIFAATRCIVRVGDSENPTDVIAHETNTDLASQLNGTRYVTVIYDLIDAYNNGYADGETAGDAAGYQRAKDELPTDSEDAKGTAVVITKGIRSVTLVNPDRVNFIKVETEK